MSNPDEGTNLNDYYNNSPQVLIRDCNDMIYSFPNEWYKNGDGGTAADESQKQNWTNGKKWDKFRENDVPWSRTQRRHNHNYAGLRDNGASASTLTNPSNGNLRGENDTLSKHDNLPGYDKKSGGWYKNRSYGYIIADRGTNRDNYAFSVYTKKNLDGFFNDMIARNKPLFLKLAARSCANKDLRFQWGICQSVCTKDDTDFKRSRSQPDTEECIKGAKEWCAADSSRVVNDWNKNVDGATHEQCRGGGQQTSDFIRDGVFDDNILNNQKKCDQSDKIGTAFCTDIRRNRGSPGMKDRLTRFLYNNHCNRNDIISNSECEDVRNMCNNTNQLIADRDPHYCNKLVTDLTDVNKIKDITTKLDLRNLSKNEVSNLLNAFAGDTVNVVEDALCNINQNQDVEACKEWNYIRSSENKLTRIKTEIDNSIRNGGKLSQEVIDYIVKDYIALQKFRNDYNKYPNSEMTRANILSFCELSDSRLESNLCKNLYNNSPYKDDAVIKASLEKINDYAYCIASKAFMNKSTDGTANTKCVARRDDPKTFAAYLPLAIQYCNEGTNIISPECDKYYNDAQKNINEVIRQQYIVGGKAAFSNKETFENDGSCNCGCKNKDSFENECECENTENDCGDNNGDYTYHYMFLFIMLICFVLVLVCINKNKPYTTKNTLEYNVIQLQKS